MYEVGRIIEAQHWKGIGKVQAVQYPWLLSLGVSTGELEKHEDVVGLD